jgi:c-di-GMP-binding flagellar brake protein YcgR
MSRSPLQPVRRTDIKIGSPLPYAVYDAHGRLLLKAGEVIETERQLTTLHEQGLYQAGYDLVRSSRPPSAHELQVNDVAEANAEPETGRDRRRLTELKLNPGKTLYVDFLSTANRPRVALRLIGLHEGGGVMISASNAEGGVVPFRDNELLFVRVLTASGVATFEAKVLKVHFTPFPYVVTSYPDHAFFHVMRQHERVDVQLICSVVNISRPVMDEARPHGAVMKNLSVSGSQVEAAPEIADVGDRVRLGFKLEAAGEEHVLSLIAEVRGVKTYGEQGKRRFGLQFAEVPTSERLVIEHCIFHALMSV